MCLICHMHFFTLLLEIWYLNTFIILIYYFRRFLFWIVSSLILLTCIPIRKGILSFHLKCEILLVPTGLILWQILYFWRYSSRQQNPDNEKINSRLWHRFKFFSQLQKKTFRAHTKSDKLKCQSFTIV